METIAIHTYLSVEICVELCVYYKYKNENCVIYYVYEAATTQEDSAVYWKTDTGIEFDNSGVLSSEKALV